MISVCLASYNGALYIKEQLLSILPQLENGDEIIVSDDCSSDDTVSIVESIGDNRIRIVNNERHHGVVSNFENALRHANGDYIFLSDQDDIWHHNKVEKCMKELKESTLILHNLRFMNTGKDFFSTRKPHHGILYNLYKNSYTGCCMAFRKELLKHILPFPAQLPMHDIWIGIQAERYGTTKFMEECLIDYRVHDKNVTFNGNTSRPRLTRYQQLRFRILTAKALLFHSIGKRVE